MTIELGTAVVMDALTTRKKTSIQSIVSFESTEDSATVLNTKFPPAQLGTFRALTIRRMGLPPEPRRHSWTAGSISGCCGDPSTVYRSAETSNGTVARLTPPKWRG